MYNIFMKEEPVITKKMGTVSGSIAIQGTSEILNVASIMKNNTLIQYDLIMPSTGLFPLEKIDRKDVTKQS